MSVKYVIIPDVGKVTFYKRRGIKSLRLSIAHDGSVRLSMPAWTPIRAGVAFVSKQKTWIDNHKSPQNEQIVSGSRIGKAHLVVFTIGTSDNISTRIIGNEIRVSLPAVLSSSSSDAQNAAIKGAIKALRKEAEELLPDRLAYLASKYDFSYQQVKIKQLKSRWGSCNSNQEISLSIYLMQLPWELIDYVILHELTHTKVLAHGSKFWAKLDEILPESRQYKKEVNKYKPTVIPTS